ncbi:MAG: penicillin-binding protein activator [Methyloglobulus sp.]|nr:ABC transporter substrate-binding protein [Methyloglobulus sp.]
MSRYNLIVPILCALVFSGCAKLPDNDSLYQEPPSAMTMEQNNNRLRTIESLIQTGKGNAAKQQAELINPAELSVPQQAKYNLMAAQILLSFGEAEQAANTLVTTQADQLSTTDKIKYYQSQAFAYSLTGNLLESSKARIALDGLLINAEERKKNQTVILETLGLLPPSAVQSQQGSLAAWHDISKILLSKAQNPARFNAELSRWQAANPGHPANFSLATVEKMPADFGQPPSSIAILLPESGSYVDAAKAIKAGFLAAHSRSSNKPELHFYNTDKAKAADLYQQAVKEGAKLVIGPLNKDSIQGLANSTTLTIPVLALNQVPNLNKTNLYQFALSPLDDATEITRKAALDGHKKAVLIVPENEQSKRITSYISENWRAQNGTVLQKLTYNTKTADFSQLTKQLLEQNQAVDAVFLSAYSKEGRALNTQLQGQRGGNLPVYALPTIYSGIADPVNDAPLNGLTFCDIPWLFNGAYTGVLSMMALKDIWQQFPGTYIRLVAMGIDAYELATKLTNLSINPYSGATGNLSLASGNRIKRNLVCAKFTSGQPELIGFSHSPGEGDYSGSNKPVIGAPTSP